MIESSNKQQLSLPIEEPKKGLEVNVEARADVQLIAQPTLQLPSTQGVQSIAQAFDGAAPSVARFINAAIADNTRRAYRQDLQDFLLWGGSVPCTPGVLAACIADLRFGTHDQSPCGGHWSCPHEPRAFRPDKERFGAYRASGCPARQRVRTTSGRTAVES